MPHKDPEARLTWMRGRSEIRNERRRKRYATDPEHRTTLIAQARKAAVKYEYGVTMEEIEQIRARQKGNCAICSRARKLCVDHDHKTGRVRGLLCSACNTAVGRLGDNVAGLERALRYLKGDAEPDVKALLDDLDL